MKNAELIHEAFTEKPEVEEAKPLLPKPSKNSKLRNLISKHLHRFKEDENDGLELTTIEENTSNSGGLDMAGGDSGGSDLSGYLDNDRSTQKIEEINSENESEVTLEEAKFIDEGTGNHIVLANVDNESDHGNLTDTSEESDSELKNKPEIQFENKKKKKMKKQLTALDKELDNYLDTKSKRKSSEISLNMQDGDSDDSEMSNKPNLETEINNELDVELVPGNKKKGIKSKVKSRFNKIKKFLKKNENKMGFIGDALFRNNVKDEKFNQHHATNKVGVLQTGKNLKKKQEDSAVDYRKVKDQEFKRFFTNGLVEKPVDSKIVIYINFFLFFRLGIFDICYLTLGHLPQIQIGTLMTMETIFFLMILRGQFKYKLFKTFFIFFRLAWQSLAIWFWLFMAFQYSHKKYTTQENGLRSIEVIYPYESITDVRMQWSALFLVFIALFFEIVHAVHQVMISIKEWYELKKEGSKLKNKKEKGDDKVKAN